MDSSNVFSKSQFNFWMGASTTHNLLVLSNFVADNFSVGKDVHVVYFDLEKAFDFIWHYGLLSKLVTLGVNRTVIRLIGNYLHGRRQFVCLHGTNSDLTCCYSGVPQGSILGPLLFSSYINDMPSILTNSKCLLFADDAKIFHAIDRTNFKEDMYQLQCDINQFAAWCKLWHLKINMSKCYIMRFSDKLKTANNSNDYVEQNSSISGVNYFLNGQLINHVSCYKDLGINYSDSFNFDFHVDQVCKKSFHALHTINKCFRFSSQNVHLLLYNSYVHPLHDYGSSVWSPSHRNQINKVEKIQCFATKYILGYPTLSYDECLVECHFMSLEKCREFLDHCLFYKLINNMSICDPGDLGIRKAHSVCHYMNVIPKFPGKFETQQEFIRHVIVKWNSLPDDIKCVLTFGKFKNSLLKYILNM